MLLNFFNVFGVGGGWGGEKVTETCGRGVKNKWPLLLNKI